MNNKETFTVYCKIKAPEKNTNPNFSKAIILFIGRRMLGGKIFG